MRSHHNNEYSPIEAAYIKRVGLTSVSSQFERNMKVATNDQGSHYHAEYVIIHKRLARLRNVLFPETALFKSTVVIDLVKTADNQYLLSVHTILVSKIFNAAPLINFLLELKDQDEYRGHHHTSDIQLIEYKWNQIVLDKFRMETFIRILSEHSDDTLSNETFVPKELPASVAEFTGIRQTPRLM